MRCRSIGSLRRRKGVYCTKISRPNKASEALSALEVLSRAAHGVPQNKEGNSREGEEGGGGGHT